MSFVFQSLTDKIIDRNKCEKEFKKFISMLNKNQYEFLDYTLKTTLNIFGIQYNQKNEEINISSILNLLNDRNLRYLLHNIQKTHYIINSKNDMFDRVMNYHKINRLLERSDQDKLCEFKIMDKKFNNEILGKGMGGVAYKVTGEDFPKPIVAKVFDMDELRNMKEIKYYEKLRNLVLNYKTPHLPLTWTDLQCGDKCVFIDVNQISNNPDMKKKWTSIKNRKCYLLFAELFNGDLTKNPPKNKDSLFSTIFQILCALYVLDKEDLYHGDLNTGNVLYLNLENIQDIKNKEYIKYKYDDKVFYIKHLNKLWSLWDFEYMNKKGERIHPNFTPDYFLSTGFFNPDTMEFIERKWGDYYDDNSKFISGSWLFDLLDISYGLTFLTRKNENLRNICSKLYTNTLRLFLRDDLSINPIESIPLLFDGIDYNGNFFIQNEDLEVDKNIIAYFEF